MKTEGKKERNKKKREIRKIIKENLSKQEERRNLMIKG